MSVQCDVTTRLQKEASTEKIIKVIALKFTGDQRTQAFRTNNKVYLCTLENQIYQIYLPHH